MLANMGLLILAAIIWGMGFVASKWTLTAYTPMWSNSLRFSIAGVVALPLLAYWGTFKRGRRYWRMGVTASLMLFVGVFFQVVGLKYTTVAKSGFLTCLYALFVPMILMATGKKVLGAAYWSLLGLCLVGIMLLCDMRFDGFNMGDFYTLLCALSFAFHILYLERIGKELPSGFEFNALQCLLIGILGVVLGFATEGAPDLAPLKSGFMGATPLAGLLFLGICSSIIAFGIQVYTQKLIPSHIVGPIFLLESPFAALFGVLLLGEVLSTANVAGCMLILVSVGLIPLTEKS